MFVQDRESARQFFFDVWRKYKAGIPLEPMEGVVSGVIIQHPEYHDFLENEGDAMIQEFSPELGMSNPFLHMGMHISIREQLGSDRPQGINAIYRRLLAKFSSPHDLEHRMMECLGEVLWSAQRNHVLPDESSYLDCLGKIG